MIKSYIVCTKEFNITRAHIKMKNIFLILYILISGFYSQIDAASGLGHPDRSGYGDHCRDLLDTWFDSISKGDIKKVKELINRVSFNARSKPGGQTALMIAAAAGHEEIVRLIIERCHNINDTDNWSRTALMYAAENGHQHIVILLLDRVANPYDQDFRGDSALSLAISNGRDAVIKLLMRCHNLLSVEFCSLNLIKAAHDGHENIVNFLLKAQEINLNYRDKMGNTALMFAASHGHMNIAQILIQQSGVDINAQNREGETALMHAIYRDHDAITQLLLDMPGVNINLKNNDGFTAADLEIKKNKKHPLFEKIKQQLIDQAFEIISGSAKTSDTIKTLDYITNIIDVDTIIDAHGNTLLDKALRTNRFDAVVLLLNKTKYLRKQLDQLPLESIDPNSDLFRYFIDLAYIKSKQEIAKHEIDRTQLAHSSANKAAKHKESFTESFKKKLRTIVRWFKD